MAQAERAAAVTGVAARRANFCFATISRTKCGVSVISFGGQGQAYRAGIVAHYVSPQAYYSFTTNAQGTFELLRAGSPPENASGACGPSVSPVSAGQWFRLRMDVSGPAGNVSILTYYNDALIHECTHATNTVASGAAGLHTAGVSTRSYFDNFEIGVP